MISKRMFTVVAVTAALLGSVAGGAVPAAAGNEVAPLSTANKIVDGDGPSNDDLADEANLCNGCTYWRGNYAGFWQAILWADGFLPPHEVDCEFGPITASATKRWQARFGLKADGIVGPQSRGFADNFIYQYDGNYYHYLGTEGRRLVLYRYTGWYQLFWNGQPSQPLGYNYIGLCN